MTKQGQPKRDGSGRGIRANKGRGGCTPAQMKETSKIKSEMGKNTTQFIKGKRSKKEYFKVDDKLHNRLIKALKPKK